MMAESKVYNSDCLAAMREMPDKAFDLAIVDPPYGIDFAYNTYQDSKENLALIIRDVLPEVNRVAERSIWFCNHRRIVMFPEPQWVISYSWNTTGSYGKAGYCQWQPILLYGDDVKGFGSVNGELKSDSIHLNGGAEVGFLRKEIIEHPCPKPKNIIAKLIKRFSLEGGSIFDPMMGSGTTRVVAHSLDRDFVGCEIDTTYFNAQEERFARHIAQPNMFAPEPVVETQEALFE